MSTIMKCPICGQRLAKHNQQFSCGKHNYDIAKEGYVNLNLNVKETAGDSKEMMQSRRDFLNLNHYGILVDYMTTVIQKRFEQIKVLVLDIGCGEGYYLDRLIKSINCVEALNASTTYQLECIGLDISKSGVKFAAKRNKAIQWIAGNSANLPIMDHSIDLALSIFSIYSPMEVCRILKTAGYLLIVRAGENHLLELRQIIYPEIIEKSKSAIFDDALFTCVSEEMLTTQIKLKGQDNIWKLLEMTPHYWKIKADNKARLNTYEELDVTLDFKLFLLKKK